ncbi:MAG TPA: hypothetical protein VGD37_04580 [Kofleriaceae bacterium]|jgi:hypothetical protein
MQIRALLLTIARAAAAAGVVATTGACTHASANLMVDVPRILPYQAPDIDEITGIDPDEAEDAGTPSGSAQTPHK